MSPHRRLSHRHSEGKQRRRWCIPTAIVRSPGETLYGATILDEFPSGLGLLLWLNANDVMLWAQAAHDTEGQDAAPTRADLFGSHSTAHLAALLPGDVPPDLLAHLQALAHLLLAHPGDADGELITTTCLAIAAWARAHHGSRTALSFAQAGALASPRFAEAALQTALYAIAVGEAERAETWLRRTIAVARRERDGSAYAHAYVALGTLYVERRGTEPAAAARAARYLRQALRAARRAADPVARRDAAFGLFRLARAGGDTVAAFRFAGLAQHAQRPGQPRSAPLLLALARFWTDRGDPHRAAGALARLAPLAAELTHADAGAAAAMAARAFAVTRGNRKSREAEARAWACLEGASTTDDAAFTAAALDLAHAAALRRDGPALDRAARAALRHAPPAVYEQARDTVARLRADTGLGRTIP